MNFARGIVAILGGIGLVSLVTQLLETTLVGAAAGGQVTDMAHYFEVRNRPSILAAGFVYNTVAAVRRSSTASRPASRRGRCAVCDL